MGRRPGLMGPDAPAVTVIVPVYDNADTVGTVLARTVEAMSQGPHSFELVAVDDHSTDDSWAVLERFVATEPRVRAIRLSENGGAGTAKGAGCAVARGRYICTIDADLDYEPSDLLAVVSELERGADVVEGVRNLDPGRPLQRSLGTTAIKWMVSGVWTFSPSDMGSGIHGWTEGVARAGVPHLVTHRDFAWAVPLFMGATSYSEVPVTYDDRSPSSYGDLRQVARLLGLGRAVMLTRVPDLGNRLAAALVGSLVALAFRRGRWRDHPVHLSGAAALALASVVLRNPLPRPIEIERVAGVDLEPGPLALGRSLT